MRRVALTGGIATGKSTILRRLRELGIPTIDSDVLARDVVAPGTPAAAAIRDRFGDGVFSGGALDRRALGDIVFRDADARSALERIVHPEVYRRIQAWFDSLPQETVAVADIPLLFETRRHEDFDAVVVAVCDPREQLARIVRRDRFTEEEARQRVAAQLPLAEKERRADYVIRTDGPPEVTRAQVDRVAEQLRDTR